MQAWKIVIPTSKVDPHPRAHDGYEGADGEEIDG